MFKDMRDLNLKFVKVGFRPGFNSSILRQRVSFIEEEFNELVVAVDNNDNAEALDALVDIVVVAIGTAIQMNWDFERAWKKVHIANMKKFAAKCELANNRNMDYDLIKPPSWVAPDLEDCV